MKTEDLQDLRGRSQDAGRGKCLLKSTLIAIGTGSGTKVRVE